MKRFKNFFTSLIGAVVMLAVIALIYLGKATLTEASGFFTIGVALLFSDDEHFVKNFLPFLYSK